MSPTALITQHTDLKVERMLEIWEDAFDSRLPEWLARFAEAPTPALDELFFRRFFHGHLQVADPEDLLVDWIQMLGDTGDFTARLDGELRAWVERRWGGVPESRRAKRWADAWQRLANVVAAVDNELPLTVEGLRGRFDEAREALGPFSTSPSRDPLGRYLWAIAGHQADRSLEADWWSMCDLGDDVVFYHGSYALGGVAGLPPPPGEEGGGFRNDVVHAVLRLGRAFDRLVAQRRLRLKQAGEEYGVVAGWALAAFPFPDRWCDALAPRWRNEPQWVRDQLVEHVHGLAKTVEGH